MSSFIVAVDGVDPLSAEEKTLQKHMLEEGFAVSMVGGNRVRYALPGHLFHCTGEFNVDHVLDLAQRASARTRSRCRIIAIEAPNVAWAGLDMLGRERTPPAGSATAPAPAPKPLPEPPVKSK